MTLAKIY